MVERIVEVYLFDTCTMKCGYCELAESGRVLDSDQLTLFRDPAIIQKITGFFNCRTSPDQRWNLILTGGEPLILPNFELFCSELFSAGNRVSIYTSLGVSEKSSAFQFLVKSDPGSIDYIMASFHPEAEAKSDDFFLKVEALKARGHAVIVRFVGHPRRLAILEELNERCRRLNVCFFPTTLFSKDYPQAYTPEEKKRLTSFFTSTGQWLQLNGGVDTEHIQCTAGNKIMALRFPSGDFTPCISVARPVLGNVFNNALHLFERPIFCPERGISCNCDVHYQQGVLSCVDDGPVFQKQKKGYLDPAVAAQNVVEQNQIPLYKDKEMRIGGVQNDGKLSYSLDETKKAFAANRSHGIKKKVNHEL